MKALITVGIMLTAAGANAQRLTQQFASCDLKAQHVVKGDIGGDIKDLSQAHISMRANVLQADLGNANKAGRLTQAASSRLFKRVEAVRTGANRYTKQQGFLSAGEVASYDRMLDAVATQICHR